MAMNWYVLYVRGKNLKKRSSLLNSRGIKFLGLDWANQSALNYICDTCGYILWFIDDGREYIEKFYEIKKIETQDLAIDYETSEAEKDECPICFTKRDINHKECSNCGHSFI